jgi:hypothetical protein
MVIRGCRLTGVVYVSLRFSALLAFNFDDQLWHPLAGSRSLAIKTGVVE